MSTGPEGGCVRATGELDVASAADLDRSLRRAEAAADADVDEIVLDVSRVDFMDAVGAELLLAASRRIRAAGRRLVVTGGTPEVQWFCALIGLGATVAIVDQPGAERCLGRSWVAGVVRAGVRPAP